MNALDLLDAIGAAEDQDILLAQKKKRKYRWIPWAAAACLLIAVGVGALLPPPAPITEPIPETHTLPLQNQETGENEPYYLVIDYKTGQETDGHKSQVRQYVNLLREMGMPQVQGFLWYIKDNKVKPV